MNPTLYYKEGYKYVTAEDYVIQTALQPPKFIWTPFITLDVDGRMTLKKGYAWDGASGPTVDTLDSMVGSLVHDGFYQLMKEGFLSVEVFRRLADRELWRLCVEDGMLKFRADYWYGGVRLFGDAAATEQNPILSAPTAGLKPTT